jgi:hypothetical protein
MISHHIHAALARERQHTLLAEAEAARRARQARPRRPGAGAACPVSRRDLRQRVTGSRCATGHRC